MELFHPLLVQAREWLKPMANMKNAMNVSSALTSLMNRTGLPAALRGKVQGWGLGALGIIVGVALILSLAARAHREEWSVRSCWAGKHQWFAVLLALVLGALGIHRFYLRRHVTGALQVFGTLPFLSGALLLSDAKMTDFLFLNDNVVGGLLLFLIGVAFVIWRLLDLFMILFGGLVPKRKRPPKRAEKQEA